MAFMVYWYFYLLCISLTRQDLVGDNVCLSESTKSCCKDYKQDGNICVECDPGFRGINCSSSCPTNYFGRRCFHKCECSSFQYCDSRRGCLCNVTSENCTDANEPDTTDTQLTKLFKITTKTSSNEQAYQSSSYVVKIGIPSLLSVIVFLIIGHICLRVYQKKKNENVKKETDHVDWSETETRYTPNGTQQHQLNREQQPGGHDSSEIYSHLNLRVSYKDTNTFSDKRLGKREKPMLFPEECPYTPSEHEDKIRKMGVEKGKRFHITPTLTTKHNEMKISSSMEDSKKDNEAENDYLDMQGEGIEKMKEQKKPNAMNGWRPPAVSKQSKRGISKGKKDKEKPAMILERPDYTITEQSQMQELDETQDRQIGNGCEEAEEDVYFDVCYPKQEANASPEYHDSSISDPFNQYKYGSENTNCENELYVNY